MPELNPIEKAQLERINKLSARMGLHPMPVGIFVFVNNTFGVVPLIKQLETEVEAFEKENEGREMSVPEVLAETLSNAQELKDNVKTLEKLNVNLVAENIELKQENFALFNRGVTEGRGQVQDDIDATERCNAQLRTRVEWLSDLLWGEDGEPETIDVDIGDDVEDELTGFAGVITRVTEYADGRFTARVERLGDAKALWFELDRLKEVK